MGYTEEEIEMTLLDFLSRPNRLETAQQILELPILAPDPIKGGIYRSGKIFLKLFRCIRFGVRKGRLHGIWEEILLKTVIYTEAAHNIGILPTDDECENDRKWLREILCTPARCPNHFIRLELFRVIRIFYYPIFRIARPKDLYKTFIQTICDIKPHFLHPTGNKKEMFFDIDDLTYFIELLHADKKVKSAFTNDISNEFNEETKVFNQTESNVTRFLSHCIKLIGVIALNAIYNPSDHNQSLQIAFCCNFVDHSNLVGLFCPKKEDFAKFCYMISCPPFLQYVNEAISDVTTAIMDPRVSKTPQGFKYNQSKRDKLLASFGVDTNGSALTRMLMHRQMNGQKEIHKNVLIKL